MPLTAGREALGGFVLYYVAARAFSDVAVDELSALGAELGEQLRHAQGKDVAGSAPWFPASSPPGARVVQFPVASDRSAVGPARHRLQDALREWETDPDVIDRATLCLSELVTNAVVHAASASWVRVTSDAGALRVTVRSLGSSSRGPDDDASDPLQVHGRGLQLVDALTTSWGSEEQAGGLMTWFELEE